MLGGQPFADERKPLFRAFGLPVHVKPGFFGFLIVASLVNGGAFGRWLSLSIGVLTLTHELGHALVARRFGANAEISLDMLAGYTSYAPTRPMKRWQRALIAFSGPMAEIAPGVLLLYMLGADPLSLSSIEETPLRKALWFAGPILGLFNLLPVLPLDGGNIASLGLDAILPGRGRRIWLWASIAVTGLGMVALLTDRDLMPLATFTAMLLFLQLQTLRNDRRVDRLRAQSKERTAKTIALQHLLDTGNVVEAAQRGAELFSRERDPTVAVLVARAAARLGEQSTSMAWIQSAAHVAHDPADVLYELDHEPDFDVIRANPASAGLRRSLGG
jgi:Zn-dependent protease